MLSCPTPIQDWLSLYCEGSWPSFFCFLNAQITDAGAMSAFPVTKITYFEPHIIFQCTWAVRTVACLVSLCLPLAKKTSSVSSFSVTLHCCPECGWLFGICWTLCRLRVLWLQWLQHMDTYFGMYVIITFLILLDFHLSGWHGIVPKCHIYTSRIFQNLASTTFFPFKDYYQIIKITYNLKKVHCLLSCGSTSGKRST